MREGIELPALFVAERQTEGRGRRGRSFYSSGGGLYMTLALPVKEEANTVCLTTKAAVSVAKALEELTHKTVGIKWINDIYYDNKKVCGILCEAVKDPKTDSLLSYIVGVGVNFNVKKFPKHIKEIAGNIPLKTTLKEKLAAKIADNLIKSVSADEDFIEYYKTHSIVLGKEVVYSKNGTEYKATAVDINANGELIVKNLDGKEEKLSSGEITLRLKQPI